MPVINRIADFHGEITAWRRDIHAHPELLYDVHRTAAAVADKLKSLGVKPAIVLRHMKTVNAARRKHDRWHGWPESPWQQALFDRF